jgi:hypothetical protein
VADSNHLPQDGLPYEVVPNFAVDAEPLDRADHPQLAELPAEPFVLQVGDVVADKGPDVLFAAYRSMTAPPPLVLIGRISDEMRRSLPEGAIALGPQPHDMVRQRRSPPDDAVAASDACPMVT